MTDRTWVGGDHNGSVYDPDNWSPAGRPQPGDTLNIVDGSASVRGGNVAGDALSLGYFGPAASNLPTSVAPVLNVSNGAVVRVVVGASFVNDSPTINVSGLDSVNISGGASTLLGKSVNLRVNIDHGVMVGSINTNDVATTIDGPGKFVNINSSFDIGTIKIDADMIGTGSTSLSFAHLELGGSVSFGQRFAFSGPESSLTIDHPQNFHGAIVAPSDPNSGFDEQVNLLGLHADSYSLGNDLLTLYAGHRVIDRIAFQSSPEANTFVGQGAAGVVIGINEAAPAGVTPLPLHGTV